MKNRNITTIIVEGADGVGKSTLIGHLLDGLKFRFMVYHRGELSNYVFAKKYHRQFIATQRGLPFLYLFLKCDEKELARRIKSRSVDEHWSEEATEHELSKASDERLFEEAAKDLSDDYNVISIDTTNFTATDTYNAAKSAIASFLVKEKGDNLISDWNKMYKKGCEKIGLSFKSLDNQPYINGRMIMSESTLQNGVYETFSDKSYPTNLIFANAYDKDNIHLQEKTVDFAYIIRSKILHRNVVKYYYKAFIEANKTCLVSSSDLIQHDEHLIQTPKVFGDKYIECLSSAKASIYIAPDLAYLKLQTARLYESILANQVVFVDDKSDFEHEILHSIYKEDFDRFDKLLTVNPYSIVKKYDEVFSNQDLVKEILSRQHSWLNEQFKNLTDKTNNLFYEDKEGVL